MGVCTSKVEVAPVVNAQTRILSFTILKAEGDHNYRRRLFNPPFSNCPFSPLEMFNVIFKYE